MNPGDKYRLKVNRTRILEDVVFNDIRDQLIQDSVLTFDDAERCHISGTKKDQMACLLDMLTRKGPDVYKHFRSALTDYPWIVELLDNTAVPVTENLLAGNNAPRERIREPYNEINNKVLKIVTRSPALRRYKSIMRELGLPEPDIDQIEYASQMDLTEQFYQCLNKWVSREGSKATVDRIIQALREEGYSDVADRLDGYTE